MIGTVEYLYNRDVNGIYYINANLPAAQSAFTGVDNRPRWVGPSCSTASAAGLRQPDQQRARQPGDQRDRAEEPGRRPVVERRRDAVQEHAASA